MKVVVGGRVQGSAQRRETEGKHPRVVVVVVVIREGSPYGTFLPRLIRGDLLMLVPVRVRVRVRVRVIHVAWTWTCDGFVDAT